jgi:hypothetical protein
MAFSVITNLIKPDVALLNTINGGIKQFVRGILEEVLIHIQTPLDPGEVGSGSSDELKSIRVGIIEVTHHSPILIHPSAPQGFVEGRVDAGKGDGTRRCKALSILCPSRTKLREMNSNASSVAKSVRNKAPGRFDSFRALHRVLHLEDRTADR